MITDVVRAADRGKVTLLFMLDLSCAFDTVDHGILLDRLRCAFGVQGVAISWIESFLQDRTQSVHIANQQSSTMKLVCGVPQGSVLGPILFLVYCADVMAIAHRHGLGVHSYADDSQLYFHADISVADDKVKQLLVCVEEMNGNRLKINKDKTQFVWLCTAHQLFRIRCQKITFRGTDIQISTEAMCLGVLLDNNII